MKKVLVNLIHPNLAESKVNKFLAHKVGELQNVTLNNLYEKYPDFQIDVKKEQALLLEHDVIVFQFPMYWFSSPALLKEWFDRVFDYNFAYGENYKLEGKIFAVATSTGSAQKEYCATGADEYTVNEFLLPLQGTAKYTKMIYRQPFVTYGTFVLSDEALALSAEHYRAYIQSL